MKYWLMKSEPDTFGIDHLARKPGKKSGWDGVRNYQARNMLRDDFRAGDRAFFHHSSCDVPGIYGTMEVARAGHPVCAGRSDDVTAQLRACRAPAQRVRSHAALGGVR